MDRVFYNIYAEAFCQISEGSFNKVIASLKALEGKKGDSFPVFNPGKGSFSSLTHTQVLEVIKRNKIKGINFK